MHKRQDKEPTFEATERPGSEVALQGPADGRRLGPVKTVGFEGRENFAGAASCRRKALATIEENLDAVIVVKMTAAGEANRPGSKTLFIELSHHMADRSARPRLLFGNAGAHDTRDDIERSGDHGWH